MIFDSPESCRKQYAISIDIFDVDDDGHVDVMIGARVSSNGKGQVYLYWGDTRKEMDSIPDKIFAGEQDGTPNLGGSTIHCGHFNNDRYGDVAIAGYSWYRFNQMGRVYIYEGNTKVAMDESPDKVLTGTLWSRFGSYFSIGDLNNDNYDDIVTGECKHGNHQGKAWIYYTGLGDATQLKFDWNTTTASLGKHTLRASIAPVQGEEETADNSMTAEVEVRSRKGI